MSSPWFCIIIKIKFTFAKHSIRLVLVHAFSNGFKFIIKSFILFQTFHNSSGVINQIITFLLLKYILQLKSFFNKPLFIY